MQSAAAGRSRSSDPLFAVSMEIMGSRPFFRCGRRARTRYALRAGGIPQASAGSPFWASTLTPC